MRRQKILNQVKECNFYTIQVLHLISTITGYKIKNVGMYKAAG